MLLTIDPDKGFQPESFRIDDYEGVYTEMPDTRAEVCSFEQNDITRMVTIKGLRCVGFEKHDKECPAWVAIEAALANDPRKLYDAILLAVDYRQ